MGDGATRVPTSNVQLPGSCFETRPAPEPARCWQWVFRCRYTRGMERVTGIGGVFFAAANPERLSEWYADMLGVAPPPASYDIHSWQQAAGPTVFAPMAANSAHFGDSGRVWSINFRVDDLDAMVAQLRDRGVHVDVDPETYPNGRFASLADPEGNGIQLWQAAGADADQP
jgi:glyoxylase I family protein